MADQPRQIPRPLDSPASDWARYIPLLLIVAVGLTFARAATLEFVQWDDYLNVGMNPAFAPPTIASLLGIWARPFVALYIPMTYTVWWGLAHLAYVPVPDEAGSQLNSWVFHSANILVHLLSVAAVFALARRLIGKDWPACAAALFFGLHPIQVDSVAWVTGMRDVLAGMLGLVALWQYVCYAQAGEMAKHQAQQHYVLATIALVAGMLAKPTDAMVPIMAAALDYWFIKRPPRRIISGLALWVALAAPVLIVARIIQSSQGLSITPLWTRPLIAGDALAFYLGKLVWPAHLAPDYGRRPQVVLQYSWVYIAWIFPALLAVAAFLFRKRLPWAPAVVVLFVAPALPTLGLTPFVFQVYSTVADHYLYLAMLGPALAVGWIVAGLSRRFRARHVAFATAVLVVSLATRSFLQIGHWQNDLTLWRHTLEVNPHSYAAHTTLGTEYQAVAHFLEAREEFKAALNELPTYNTALNNMIILDTKLPGKWDESMELGRLLIAANRSLPTSTQLSYLNTYDMLCNRAISIGDGTRAMWFLPEIHRLNPADPAPEQAMELIRRTWARRSSTTAATGAATTTPVTTRATTNQATH